MLEFKDVKFAANGKSEMILIGLGVAAEYLTGKHCPCPGCGGDDRFRYDKQKECYHCGGGGEYSTGDVFDLLSHVNGWSTSIAFKEVAEFLGVKPDASPEAKARSREYARQAEAIKLEKKLSHEMTVLQQVLFARSNDKSYPKEHWDREIEAAREIFKLIKVLYAKPRV